jgi:hypothetical protein
MRPKPDRLSRRVRKPAYGRTPTAQQLENTDGLKELVLVRMFAEVRLDFGVGFFRRNAAPFTDLGDRFGLGLDV